MPDFSDLLHDQVRNEFEASQQYVAVAVRFDGQEVASKTLLNICDRGGDNLFHLEDHMAREMNARRSTDATAPTAAGGIA